MWSLDHWTAREVLRWDILIHKWLRSLQPVTDKQRQIALDGRKLNLHNHNVSSQRKS